MAKLNDGTEYAGAESIGKYTPSMGEMMDMRKKGKIPKGGKKKHLKATKPLKHMNDEDGDE